MEPLQFAQNHEGFDYDGMRERLTELALKRRQIQRSLALYASPGQPNLRQNRPVSLAERSTNIRKAEPTQKMPKPPAKVAQSNSKLQSQSTLKKSTPSTRSQAGSTKSVALNLIYDKYRSVLSQLGGYVRLSFQAGLQAAGASVALVRDEDGNATDIAQSAVLAAHAARVIVSIGYTEEILRSVCNGLKIDPHTGDFMNHARTLSNVDDFVVKNASIIGACLAATGGIFLTKHTYVQSETNFDQLIVRTFPPNVIRLATEEAKRTWTSCRSLRFSEGAMMTMRETMGVLNMIDCSVDVHSVILIGILAIAFNVSRKQPLTTARTSFCISLLASIGAETSASSRMSLQTRAACFATAAACDDIWQRYQKVVQSEVQPSKDRVPDEPIPEMLLNFSKAHVGMLRERLLEAARIMGGLLKMLESDRIELYSANFQEILVKVKQGFQSHFQSRTGPTPLEVALSALKPAPSTFGGGASAEDVHSPREGMKKNESVVGTERPPQVRSTEPVTSPSPSNAGERRGRRSPNRLFDDWTSESSSSWLSEGEERSEDEATRTFASRLNDARTIASRYGIFQTTHPNDVARLLEPLPLQY